MAASSITTGTFELRTPADALVAASLAYDAGTRTATLVPAGALAHATPYTATLKGGPTGVTDTAGNPLASTLSWSFTTAADEPPTTGTAPNVLLIVADDVGAESSSLYPSLTGTSVPISMPTIESLAANGLVFDNAWASPLCSPTRATILTGLYGNRTGVTYVGNRLPTTTDSLFKYIARESPAAYGMGVFGKWHLSGTNGNGSSAHAAHVRDTGVPNFWGFFGGGISNYFSWTAYDINGTAASGTTYATTATTNEASDFIRQHQATRPDDPWFVYLPYNAAHSPYHVPPASLLQPGTPTNDNRARFKAAMQAMDAEISRLFDEIDLDLSETLVIFMGDNGTPADVKPPGTIVRSSKTSVYEGGIKVPMVVAGAGVTRTGREGALVVSTDLYATIAAATGIPVSHVYDSFSIVPLLTTAGATTGRTHAFSEVCSGTLTRRYAIRDARYKLLYDNGSWGLYDLVNDPSESSNLYSNAAYSEVRSNLDAELQVIAQDATAGCFQ
jgi:arylsulfatase A-like enzyme